MTDKVKSGTKEWSEVSKNLFIGCKHNCIYCYGRLQTPCRVRAKWYGIPWEIMTPTLEAFEKPKLYDGKQIMFPTIHDILPENLPYTMKYLEGLLKMGNKILIVSKPHFECIETICKGFSEFKPQILFRFSIGSTNSNFLKLFEPNAPTFEERFDCLEYAYTQGYQTSVSCEPRYDVNMIPLIKTLMPYVNDTIWIGQINHLKDLDMSRLNQSKQRLIKDIINSVQSIKNTIKTFQALKDNPKIKYKYEVRKLIEENTKEGIK